MVKRSTLFIAVALLLLLTAGGSTLGYILGKKVTTSECVNQYWLTKDVAAGKSLEGSYEAVSIQKDKSMPTDSLVLNEDDIKEGIAVTYMYKHQPITKSSITTEDDQDRNLVFNMPVTVEGALANAVTEGDLVAIKVKFKENDKTDVNREDEVVVAKIKVVGKRTSNGQNVEDNKSAPAFLIFNVTNDEENKLNNASKKGLLYITKYRDLNGEPLEEDYLINK